MALVQEHEAHQLSLSSPIPIPFRNPSRPHSRHSQFGDRPRMAPPSSPPSSPPQEAPGKRSHDDERANDIGNASEKISPLDPRRFTPTLHTSLVAEILSLRRDLELKTRDINHLEESLYSVKVENDTLTVNFAAKAQEARTLKHEMKLLEGGTQTALIDVAKERDKALDAQSDLRNRLEIAQKRTNAQQEETQRNQDRWQCEREAWENDRRHFERQVHVMEGRLKTVLNEFASSQAVNEDEEADRVSSLSEIKSRRHYHKRQASTTSTGTLESEGRERHITSAGIARTNSTKTSGGNLADELAFGEDDEPEDQDDSPGEDEFDSSDALPEERSSSALSRPMDLKARKLLGLSTDNFGFSSSQSIELDATENVDGMDRETSSTNRGIKSEGLPHTQSTIYVDAGVQYTPPPSPSQEASKMDGDISRTNGSRISQALKSTIHKPDNAALPPASWAPLPHLSERSPLCEMISTGCQTTEDVVPLAQSDQGIATFPTALAESTPPDTRSMATQTDGSVQLSNTENVVDELNVPIIAIHPPSSRPATPNTRVVLPPRTKNASCQVVPTEFHGCRSIAVQTDIIRVDKRFFHRATSANAIEPMSKADEVQSKPIREPKSASQRNDVKLPSRPLREPPPIPPAAVPPHQTHEEGKGTDVHLGSNDNSLVTENSKEDSKIPLRTSSLFAELHMSNESGSSHTMATPFDEDDIFTRPTVSYTLKAGKMVAKQPISPTVKNAIEDFEDIGKKDFLTFEGKIADSSCEKGLVREPQTTFMDKKQPIDRPKPLKLASSSKQPNFRRAAMVSSSTAAHQTNRARSPSLPTMGARPPFPVPTRNSSRNLPLSGSEDAQSPTRIGRGQIKRGDSSTDLQGLSLRKVRSTTSLNPLESPSEFPQSPVLMSPLSDCTESPSLPPLPSDDVTWPKRSMPHQLYDPSNAESTDSTFQQTTVVDAIAQTMVGEWMWKYVRKRKSFGVTDSRAGEWELGKNSEELSAHITSTGVRHKRWVWIEPYERVVMWSSKQPTSGSALLGKGGRKLAIQSVLDVRDDNPLPKSATATSPISPTGSGFNRSILILTPQRALKFTAMTQERHYVWLNALSFLSHSPLSINDLSAVQPGPHDEYPAPAPPVHGGTGSLRRSHVRDSIRVAKAKDREKTRPGLGGPRSFTNDGVLRHKGSSIGSPPLYYGPNSPITQAADPPIVPRHSARRRANTATSISTKGASRSRPAIPGAFRSYSANTTTPAIPPPPTSVTLSIASSDMLSSSRLSSARDSLSRQPSENSASELPGQMASKYFENVGTMRMEAFIKEERDRKLHLSRGLRRGRKKDRAEVVDELLSKGEDPFRGF